jgi:hypothetical protein
MEYETTDKEQWKNQRKVTKAQKDIATPPQAHRTDQIADSNAFAFRKPEHRAEAADIDKGAVHSPPMTCLMPRIGPVLPGENQRSKSLTSD